MRDYLRELIKSLSINPMQDQGLEVWSQHFLVF